MRGRDHGALLDEYDTLAPDYDARWASYTAASVRDTLGRLDVHGGERVLDVGCGTGVLLEQLASAVPGAALTGIDASAGMLRIARGRLAGKARLVRGFGEALPFVDAAFDAVVSSSAFHFFVEPRRALREMARVLRPAGQLVMTDWCTDFLGSRVLDLWLRVSDSAHVRAYRAREWRLMLDETGFEHVSVERYKIDRFWGLMTAVAHRGAARGTDSRR